LIETIINAALRIPFRITQGSRKSAREITEKLLQYKGNVIGPRVSLCSLSNDIVTDPHYNSLAEKIYPNSAYFAEPGYIFLLLLRIFS